jgi:hypothetical protein
MYHARAGRGLSVLGRQKIVALYLKSNSSLKSNFSVSRHREAFVAPFQRLNSSFRHSHLDTAEDVEPDRGHTQLGAPARI